MKQAKSSQSKKTKKSFPFKSLALSLGEWFVYGRIVPVLGKWLLSQVSSEMKNIFHKTDINILT